MKSSRTHRTQSSFQKTSSGFSSFPPLPQYQAAAAFEYQNYNLSPSVLCYYTVEQSEATLVQRGTRACLDMRPCWGTALTLVFQGSAVHHFTCSSSLSFFLSQQLLDGLPWNFVQTFIMPSVTKWVRTHHFSPFSPLLPYWLFNHVVCFSYSSIIDL